MAEEYPSPPRPRNGIGTLAFILGIVALPLSFVPGIGDFIAIPAAVAAIVLGLIGFDRAEKGIATNRGEALTGSVLGVIAGFVMFLVFAATMGPAT